MRNYTDQELPKKKLKIKIIKRDGSESGFSQNTSQLQKPLVINPSKITLNNFAGQIASDSKLKLNLKISRPQT